MEKNSSKKRRVSDEEMVNNVELAPMSKSLKCRSSEALDLMEERDDGEFWDFAVSDHRAEVIKKVQTTKPILVIGTSRRETEALRRWSEDKDRNEVKQRMHMDVLLSIYKEQEDSDRYFVHEQVNAASEKGKKGFHAVQNINSATMTVEAKKFKDVKKKMMNIVTNSPRIAAKIGSGTLKEEIHRGNREEGVVQASAERTEVTNGS